MAKASGMELLEQHVEKVVLGLCGLVLAFVLIHWGLSSPREFGPDKVPPSKVDSWLLSQAQAVEVLVNSVEPPPLQQANYVAMVKQQIDNPMPDKYLRVPDFTTARVPAMVGTSTGTKDITIEELSATPAPGKLTVWAKQILPKRTPYADVLAANGVAVYPWSDLAKLWTDKLKASRVPINIVVLEVLVERQEQNPDGTWTAAPVLVKITPEPVTDASGAAASIPAMPEYSPNAIDAIRDAIDQLKSTWQQQILQPRFADIFWPSTRQWADWRVFLPPTELSTTDGGQPVSAVRGEGAAAQPLPGMAPVAPEGGMRGLPPPPPGAPGAGLRPLPPPPPQPARGNMRPLPPGPAGRGAPPARGGPPPALPRAEPIAPIKPAAPAEPQVPMMASVPTLPRQIELGKVLAWFCDTSLEGGKVYRFRVQLKLLNPLYSYGKDIKNPADGEKPAILTPWSAWSDEIPVPRAAEFFLASANASTGAATVDIFARSLGRVVRQTATVQPGQVIGKKDEKASVTDPDGATVQHAVDFTTGAVVVGMNFHKQVFKGTMSKETVEMLYLDADGQLRSRLLELDRDSKVYRDLIDQAKAPAAALRRRRQGKHYDDGSRN